LESAVVEDVVPVGIPHEGDDVDITVVGSDTLVCTPDVEVVVVGDTNDDLASALALTLSASELSENSWEDSSSVLRINS